MRPSESRELMFTFASIAACTPGTSPVSAAFHNWSGATDLVGADFAAAGGVGAATGAGGVGSATTAGAAAGVAATAATDVADARRVSLLRCWAALCAEPAELAAVAGCASLPALAPLLWPADRRCWVARAFAWVCARAAAAEAAALAASVCEDAAGDVVTGEAAADVGAGGGGSAECSAVESGAGDAGSDGCVVAAVGGGEAGAVDRVGASASALGAGA